MLWSATYAVLGYIFSNKLDRIATYIMQAGAYVALAVAVVVGFVFARKAARWQCFLRQFKLARITPEQSREKLELRTPAN
jgi:membrane protein DedA with SNARE-associated domain